MGDRPGESVRGSDIFRPQLRAVDKQGSGKRLRGEREVLGLVQAVEV